MTVLMLANVSSFRSQSCPSPSYNKTNLAFCSLRKRYQSEPKRQRPNAAAPASASTTLPSISKTAELQRSEAELETRILSYISGVTGRGKEGLTDEQAKQLAVAVDGLEGRAAKTREGQRLADSPSLAGRWRLLYTSRPGTASPIQRVFTGIDAFTVYQEIIFDDSKSSASKVRKGGDDISNVRVNNIVDFGAKLGYLKVEACASTLQRPIPNFVPRKGKGTFFGLLGTSSIDPALCPGQRVDFQFDRAAFYFKFLPFSIPYPVPFRALGDETKGWLDVTYISKDGTFRISRGNKGTLFLLVKDEPLQTKLLESIKLGMEDRISAIVEELKGKSVVGNPARSPLARGAWKLLWSKQDKSANVLQRSLIGSTRNWQIISEDGQQVENVSLLPGVTVRAVAQARAVSDDRTEIVIDQVLLELGPFKFNIPVRRDEAGFIEWLFLDNDMRVTRGNKGSVFVHVRDLEGQVGEN
jgi:hypothetical protein